MGTHPGVDSTSGRSSQGDEIDGADAVPGLQVHEGLQAELGVHVLEAFAVLDLHGVGVADHVVMEDDAAEPGEHDAAGLVEVFGAFLGCFGAGFFVAVPVIRGGEAGVLPMAMCVEHDGELARFAGGGDKGCR